MRMVTRPFRWLAARPVLRSLKTRLLTLVILATLPSLILLLLTANQQRDDALQSGRNEAARLARLVADDQRDISAQISTVMGSLALTAELRGNELESCRSLLQSVVSPGGGGEPDERLQGIDVRVDGVTFRTLAVLANDQQVRCQAPGDEDAITSEDSALAVSALERGRLVTGNQRVGASGSLVMTYALPLPRDDGQGRLVLLAVVEVYALSTFAVNGSLPDDAFILVFNGDGIIEQRYPQVDDQPTVGTSLAGTPAVDEAVGRGSNDDVSDVTELNGEEYIFGVDDFWRPGADGSTRLSYVMVATPRTAVVQQAESLFNQNLGKLAIAGLIGVVAAWVGADLLGGRDGAARKGRIRDLYHAYSTGDTTNLEQIFGAGYVDRSTPKGEPNDLEALRHHIAAFWAAFPDGKIVIRDLLADGDKVIARVTLTGTHQGEFAGIPPSGAPVVADGVETFRFLHGMVVESWSMFTNLRPKDPAPVAVEDVPPKRRSLVDRLFRRKPKRKPAS